MNIANAHSAWAPSHDADRNPTRNLDAQVTRQVIDWGPMAVIVEAGCGTGKNTRHFAQMAQRVHAMDFSPGIPEDQAAGVPRLLSLVFQRLP